MGRLAAGFTRVSKSKLRELQEQARERLIRERGSISGFEGFVGIETSAVNRFTVIVNQAKLETLRKIAKGEIPLEPEIAGEITEQRAKVLFEKQKGPRRRIPVISFRPSVINKPAGTLTRISTRAPPITISQARIFSPGQEFIKRPQPKEIVSGGLVTLQEEPPKPPKSIDTTKALRRGLTPEEKTFVQQTLAEQERKRLAQEVFFRPLSELVQKKAPTKKITPTPFGFLIQEKPAPHPPQIRIKKLKKEFTTQLFGKPELKVPTTPLEKRQLRARQRFEEIKKISAERKKEAEKISKALITPFATREKKIKQEKPSTTLGKLKQQEKIQTIRQQKALAAILAGAVSEVIERPEELLLTGGISVGFGITSRFALSKLVTNPKVFRFLTTKAGQRAIQIIEKTPTAATLGFETARVIKAPAREQAFKEIGRGLILVPTSALGTRAGQEIIKKKLGTPEELLEVAKTISEGKIKLKKKTVPFKISKEESRAVMDVALRLRTFQPPNVAKVRITPEELEKILVRAGTKPKSAKEFVKVIKQESKAIRGSLTSEKVINPELRRKVKDIDFDVPNTELQRIRQIAKKLDVKGVDIKPESLRLASGIPPAKTSPIPPIEVPISTFGFQLARKGVAVFQRPRIAIGQKAPDKDIADLIRGARFALQQGKQDPQFVLSLRTIENMVLKKSPATAKLLKEHGVINLGRPETLIGMSLKDVKINSGISKELAKQKVFVKKIDEELLKKQGAKIIKGTPTDRSAFSGKTGQLEFHNIAGNKGVLLTREEHEKIHLIKEGFRKPRTEEEKKLFELFREQKLTRKDLSKIRDFVREKEQEGFIIRPSKVIKTRPSKIIKIKPKEQIIPSKTISKIKKIKKSELKTSIIRTSALKPSKLVKPPIIKPSKLVKPPIIKPSKLVKPPIIKPSKLVKPPIIKPIKTAPSPIVPPSIVPTTTTIPKSLIRPIIIRPTFSFISFEKRFIGRQPLQRKREFIKGRLPKPKFKPTIIAIEKLLVGKKAPRPTGIELRPIPKKVKKLVLNVEKLLKR